MITRRHMVLGAASAVLAATLPSRAAMAETSPPASPWSIDVVDRGRFDDPAGIHHQRPVGELAHHPQIVGDQQHPGAGDIACGFEHLEDLRLHGDVESGGRLVADQQVGIVGDRDRDHHALTFTTGQLVRKGPRAPLGLRDADQLEQLDRALPGRPLSVCG